MSAEFEVRMNNHSSIRSVGILISVSSGVLSLLPAWLMGVEVIALRGASHEAPGNTLPALQRAWEQKADAVEVNVQVPAH